MRERAVVNATRMQQSTVVEMEAFQIGLNCIMSDSTKRTTYIVAVSALEWIEGTLKVRHLNQTYPE